MPGEYGGRCVVGNLGTWAVKGGRDDVARTKGGGQNGRSDTVTAARPFAHAVLPIGHRCGIPSAPEY